MEAPISQDQSFKITWRLENFCIWAGHNARNSRCPSTPTFAIETLGNTEWQFKLCAWKDEKSVACIFERAVDTDVEDNIDVHYTFYTLGHDSLPYFLVTGIISNLKPGDKHIVTTIPMANLKFDNWPEDLLSTVCEIRHVEPRNPVEFSQSKWKDELESLSDDMRKLFVTSYLSDLKLVSDDGRRIAVHSFVLIARWRKLCDSLSENGFTTRIAVHGVSGSVLSAFVSYLYTGALSGSDVTAELFQFVVENEPWMRKLFHSLTSDICMRTHQRKDHLSFTWYVDNLTEDCMPFFRVLPLQQVDGKEVVMVLDIEENEKLGERCLAVVFSLSNVPEESYIALECKATLFIGDDCVQSHSKGHSYLTREEWHFQSFIPMRLLTNGAKEGQTCPRVQFELVISDMPQQSVVESCVTEFRTGSRGIRKVEQLTSAFRQFFMLDPRVLCDVILRTEGGSFFSSRAVLSVRSRTFLRFFRNRRKGTITVDITETDSVALAGILEYVYTGWTKLSTFEEVHKMLLIAKRLCLMGLVEKCQKFIDSQSFHQTLVV